MVSIALLQPHSSPETSPRILLIERDEQLSQQLSSRLQQRVFGSPRLINVAGLQQAVDELSQEPCDLILLSDSLTECDCMEAIERLRLSDTHAAIVVLSASDDADQMEHFIKAGAQDYLPHSVNDELLRRTVRYAMDRKKAEQQLEILTRFDALTGLVNRNLFMDRLQQALNRSKRNRSVVGLMYLDLDKFKTVNDTLGHEAGDQLLQKTADRLRQCVRATDTVARLAADEFAILLEDIQTEQSLIKVANKIIQYIAQPFTVHQHRIFAQTSVGIATCRGDNENASDLLKNADIAMFRAKKKGGSRFQYFTPELQATAAIRSGMEQSLQRALDENEFCLFYQPQIDALHNRLIGAEALLRWNHPDHGLIAPYTFIPALEDTGLIHAATEWVLSQACAQWYRWQQQGQVPAEAHLSVNLSAMNIRNPYFVEVIQNVLNNTSLPPHLLELEITESIFLAADSVNLDHLTHLRNLGVRLSMDDFGTGYSSLSYLKHFKLDSIKLDRSFVNDILDNEVAEAIAVGIIQLAKKLKLRIIAEGVDSEEKLRCLQENDCHLIQGFFFSKPLPDEQFCRFAEQLVTSEQRR